jgi:hypothetical protein
MREAAPRSSRGALYEKVTPGIQMNELLQSRDAGNAGRAIRGGNVTLTNRQASRSTCLDRSTYARRVRRWPISTPRVLSVAHCAVVQGTLLDCSMPMMSRGPSSCAHQQRPGHDSAMNQAANGCTRRDRRQDPLGEAKTARRRSKSACPAQVGYCQSTRQARSRGWNHIVAVSKGAELDAGIPERSQCDADLDESTRSLVLPPPHAFLLGAALAEDTGAGGRRVSAGLQSTLSTSWS